MKKILIQNTTYFPSKGGIDTYMYNLASNNKNVDFLFLVLDSNQKSLENIEIISIFDIFRIPPKYRRIFIRFDLLFSIVVFFYTLLNLNKIKQYQIISRHPIYALSNLLFKNVKLLLATVLPLYISTAKENSGLLRRIYLNYKIFIYSMLETIAVKNSQIYTLSENIKNQVLDNYEFIGENEINVNKPGVDLEKFPFVRKQPLEINDQIKLVTVCRLSLEKNLSLIFEAMKINKCLTLDIVGDGPEMENLKNSSIKKNIDNRVNFHGFKKDFKDILHSNHLFVLPSTYEGFGHVYIEAMATGLPCIGLNSELGYKVATNEIIIPGRNGELIENTPESLNQAIDKIVDGDKLEHYSENSYQISKEFSWAKHLKYLIEN